MLSFEFWFLQDTAFTSGGAGMVIWVSVVSIVYTRMASKFVRTGEFLLAVVKFTDKRFFASVCSNVACLEKG